MISTVKEVGKLSAKKMKLTKRVGDPLEDASMSVARPILSEINFLGFVTIDSQMGKKESLKWQRSYIEGFISRKYAKQFSNQMELIGETLVLVKEHLEDDENVDFSTRIPVTKYTLTDGSVTTPTNIPISSDRFENQWINLLPETDLSDDMETMYNVKDDAMFVTIVDMTWGRPMWLFETVKSVLSRRNVDI